MGQKSERLTTGALAALLASTALVYVLAGGSGPSQDYGLWVELGGIAVLLVGLWLARSLLVALALPLLVGPEALVLALRGPVLLAPLLGAALLAAAELAFWSADFAAVGSTASRLVVALSVRLLLTAGAGAVLGGLVLLVAALPAGGGVDLTLLGALAAVGVLGLTAWLLGTSLAEDRAAG